jgi:hypothetical protein
MPSKKQRTTAGLLAMGFCFAAAIVAVNESAGQAAPTPEPPTDSTETPDAPAERALEAPLDAANGTPTLLEYEPTETISEDKSVSFPVDI